MPQGFPQGFCVPPFCWQHTFNFAAAGDILIKPKHVPNWAKGVKLPLGTFPAMEAALTAALNAAANLVCDDDCACVRLNRNALAVALPPLRMGPVPGGVRDVYMEGVTITTWWGVCLAKKKGVRVKKGDQWIPVEDLPASDILTPPSSPGGGHKKKKGKKGKKRKTGRKARRAVKRRR